MTAVHARRASPGDFGRLRSLGLLAVTSWRADRARTIGAVGCTMTDQLAQLLAYYSTKLVVDAAAAGRPGRAVWWGVVIGTAVAVSYLANAVGSTVSNGLRERTSMAFEARLVALLASLPGIEHFERPELLDRIEMVRQERWSLGAVVHSTLNMLNVGLQLLGTTVVLAVVEPVLLFLPLAGVAPFLVALRSDRVFKRAEDETAEDQRLAVRLQERALDPRAAAELRLHALVPVVLERHRAAYARVVAVRRAASVRSGLVNLAGDTVLAAAQIGAVAVVAARATGGHTTPGDVVLVITLALRLRYQIYWVVGSLDWLLRALRTVGRLGWVAGEAERAGLPEGDATVPDRLVDGIRFEGVGFTYPGTALPVLSGVDLHFPAGSTVAVVGENGAGKSTIVKLLSRFYEPTEGRITVDGTELHRLPLDAWRARLAGAFQDHARLEFVARHTVGVGDLVRVDDDPAVEAAIGRAGATPVLASLPDGLRTQLGTRFEGGAELSGGQWQQLALGRAMMREAPLLLLLDEPTAALDPGTEHRLFERYADAARAASAGTGAITVLVSHRFSTVRMADLIVVVAGGRVVQAGTHDELVAAGGLYAELYSLQARAYRA
ncbi:MAG: ABC transporter ATP-binding protein/permease [Actinomycetota bacterium]|nr:ABC transporter ATP-binding protein/permease [Actinomycetota bacterium]